MKRETLLRRWRSVPGPIRKSVVLTIGITLVAVGAALVILPGPFTLPFVIGGIAVLSSEFVWAARIMERGQQATTLAKEWVGRVPAPWLAVIVIWAAGTIGVAAWWWFVHRS